MIGKTALVLVLCFLAVQSADHHSHDHNHQDSHAHTDALSAFDHHFHEYHHHHPVEQPNCGQVCPKTLSRMPFEVGHVYTVDLDGQTLINVKEGQTIGVKTKIDVHVLSPCEFSLSLHNSQVSGVPNAQELAQQLDASPVLRFGAHDGKVLGVCPAPEEQAWTLNIKKAALSAMQITSKDLSVPSVIEEVDFSGHCTTTYRPLSDTSDPANILVEKTKNLNKCHLRRKNIAGFNSKSLGLLTEFLRENLPILKSNQRCVQEIKGGHLISVSCNEEQRVAIDDDSLIVSTLKMKFDGKAPKDIGTPGPVPPSAQTLLMTRDDEGQKTSSEADVLNLLKTMCDQVSGDVLSPQVTESFHSLVRGLRNLPEAGTRTLDKATKSGELCASPKLRQMFLGASGFAASDASIQTLISAYNDKELSDTQITLLLGLVALKTRPSEKTIESLATLIQKDHDYRSLSLGVSLMVRNFCKRNENCLDTPAVKKVVSALIDKLQKTDCNLERITAIKALDNIKAKTDETVKSTLLTWALNSEADSGVRIAAIQALKRLADDAIRQKLIEILTKHSEPTEVRVSAYRSAILSGVNPQQLDQIKSGVDPQLKNYIQSHIKNLRKNRPDLLPANAADIGEPPILNLGVTRNVQLSYKGATIESDVVYPKGSLIPNLYTFGIWFPVGGKEYSLVEIQMRQSGLSEHIHRLISKGIGGPEVLAQLSEQLLEMMNHLKDPNHKHTVALQLSVRISGSNLIFIDTLEDLHKIVHLIREKLSELYNSDKVDMARALSILDQQVEVPSILGFPMMFNLNETLVIGMTAEHSWTDSGSNKVRKVKSSRTYLDELAAGVTLKVRNYRPGAQYKLRVELNPTTDAQFERIENRIVKAKINLPAERRTLAKLVHSAKLVDGYGNAKTNEIARMKREADRQINRCRQMIGLNLCAEGNWPAGAPLPNLEYYVTRMDPNVESVELTLEKPPAVATQETLVWSAKAKAGAREYLAQVELKNPVVGQKKVSLKLVSPKRTITADTTMLKSEDGNSTKIEMDLKLPNVIDVNTKYNFEQKGEEQQIDILTEYQCAGQQKETIKWNRKSSMSFKREKKSKVINVSYNHEFQSSQFPQWNSKLTYYTNMKPYQNSKSDFKFEWGQELKDRLRLVHTSTMDIIELRPFQATSENGLLVEYTPKGINYDLKLKTDISMIKSKPKHISLDLQGNDVQGRPEYAVKSTFVYERSEQPIVQTINATLAYPGREMTYYSETKQIKDLTFAGKIIVSPQKGKSMIIEHKMSSTNPTKDFHAEIEADVSYSHKPDKVKAKFAVGWITPDKFEYKHTYARDGQKYSEWDLSCDKTTYGCQGKMVGKDRQAEFKIDNVKDPRTASWGLRYGPKSYKFSAVRVPRDSLTIKLDSSENSRLKELRIKLARKEKSTFKMVTSDNMEVNSYLDLVSKDKKAHLDFKCPQHQLDHTGDIVLSPQQRKITWDSKTNMHGKPYLSLEMQLSPKDKTFLILKKLADGQAKFEYTFEKGVYKAVIDSDRYSALLEGEVKAGKNFGKLNFVDKEGNYEHKSQYNVVNGVLTIKAVGDQDNQSVRKLEGVIGARIVSNVTLTTPTVNAKLTANPLGDKKTLQVKWVSPRYEHNSDVEWVPRKYLKLDSVSQRKTTPPKTMKVNAYLTREEDSSFKMTAPQLDVDVRRVRAPKPRYIFNTTINGYNEVQEFDSNPSLTPIQNLMVALNKYFQTYLTDN